MTDKDANAITPAQVEHIAHLARIELREGDRERFAHQLGDILGYVNTLQKLDTTGIDPTFLVTPRSNVMREDDPAPSFTPDEALKNAPGREDDYFKTPRILNI
jgi:aspartyl-tRNA(Asn)/glutamyl-tRNA(Gln) amidotransferase subunit C